jgi:hypothetical protein
MKSGLYEDTKVFSTDNYTLDLFRQCPRKFWWRIGKDLSRKPSGYHSTADTKTISHAPELQFGIAMHKGLDELYLGHGVDAAHAAFLESFGDCDDPKGKRTPGRGMRIITKYDRQWHTEDEQWETIQCEAKFELNLGEILGYTVLYHGALDKIRRRRDAPTVINIVDHKTTSFAHGAMMQTWEISNQFYGYYAGARGLMGPDADISFTTDVLIINPKSDDFQRQTISPTAEQLAEWRTGILATSESVIRQWLKADGDFKQFPKHSPSRCFDYMRPCAYLDLCTSISAHIPMTLDAMYYPDPWDPAER